MPFRLELIQLYEILLPLPFSLHSGWHKHKRASTYARATFRVHTNTVESFIWTRTNERESFIKTALVNKFGIIFDVMFDEFATFRSLQLVRFINLSLSTLESFIKLYNVLSFSSYHAL